MALPEAIAVGELFGQPGGTRASISPDGTRLAYLAPWKERLNVWVQRLDEPDEDPHCVTADDVRGVLDHHWTDDPRWLLFAQESDGEENRHLYRVDLDDPDAPAIDLTPFTGARVAHYELLPGRGRGRAGKVAVQLNLTGPDAFDLYEADIATGALTLLAENPGHPDGWLFSTTGDIYAHALNADGDFELSRWDSASGTLRPLLVRDGTDHPLGIHPVQLTPDGAGLWLGSYGDGDRMSLVRVDLATGEESEADSHPDLDLDTRSAALRAFPSPLVRDRRTGELLGVRYLGERQVIRALDPHFAEVLERLEQLSDGDLSTLSSDDSGQRWVVSFTHDRDPHATWFYDHATGRARPLFRPYAHLDPETLAPMRPVTVTARDGLRLRSYLTLPVGVEPAGLPMVLLVHGGPWHRDSWGFHPLVQFLANHGYAVLQVNYRGSTGCGRAHLSAGVGEFAGKMNDDLVDAVEWAVGQGYADRGRVAVLGGSYGGYAALVGAGSAPDVFAAAVDIGGIVNLAHHLRSLSALAGHRNRHRLAHNWHRFVGDPDATGDPDAPAREADLLARSPVGRVDRIRVPLMVVQGADDVRVDKGEVDRLVGALRMRGVEVEHLVKENVGHTFVNTEDELDVHHAVRRFLARHLGGGRDGTAAADRPSRPSRPSLRRVHGGTEGGDAA
ncbi:alpha/beta fold hydrolase [Streptomyces sp. NPDC048172]|uniref:S9 family peptidase n=1 Tax=Streptomyces sp. NPDC048172 TaxID=3365505 RepID=UPI003718B7E7